MIWKWQDCKFFFHFLIFSRVFDTPELSFINLYYNIVREKSLIEKDFSIIDYGRYVKYASFWYDRMKNLKQCYKFKFQANFSEEFNSDFFDAGKNILKNSK